MHRTTASLLALTMLVLFTGALIPTSARGASTSERAVNALNQVRAQVGVPLIANDETLAGDCQSHANWMSQTGTISHWQTNGPTPANNGEDAGRHGVLSMAFNLRPQVSPQTIHWMTGAPLHLFQLLHPGLVRSGYAYTGMYACMYSLSPQLRDVVVHDRTLGAGQFFTWPNAGATNVPFSEDTSTESPNPNEALGLPRTQVTGPYLLVYAGGFGNPVDPLSSCNEVALSGVTLADASGAAVKVRWMDDATSRAQNPGVSNPFGSCRVPSGGGLVVAERPLRPATTYTVTVRALGLRAPAGTEPTSHSWSFTTAKRVDRTRPIVRLRSTSLRRGARSYRFRFVLRVRDASRMTCSAVVAGRTVRCRVKGGTVTLAGTRAGRPRTVKLRVVVKDASRNSRTLTKSLRLR